MQRQSRRKAFASASHDEHGARLADPSSQATAACMSPAPPVQPTAREWAHTSAKSVSSSQTALTGPSASIRKPRTAESRSRSAGPPSRRPKLGHDLLDRRLEGAVEPVVLPELHESPFACHPRRQPLAVRIFATTSARPNTGTTAWTSADGDDEHVRARGSDSVRSLNLGSGV